MGYKLNYKLGSDNGFEKEEDTVKKYPNKYLIALFVNRFSVSSLVIFLIMIVRHMKKEPKMKSYIKKLDLYLEILGFLYELFIGNIEELGIKVDESKIKFVSLPIVNDYELVKKFNNLTEEKISQLLIYEFENIRTERILEMLAEILKEEIEYGENPYIETLDILVKYLDQIIIPALEKIWETGSYK